VETLVLRNFSGVPEITPDAFKVREKALTVARPIQSVTNETEQLSAVAALRELTAVRKGMETTRKAVKAPVLDLGKKIDTIAADFIEDVLWQEGRLRGLINHFQRKQIEAAQAEADRVERERKEAEVLAAKAAQEQDPNKKAALQSESFEKLMESDVSQAPVVVKLKGLVVRQRVNFKVIDPIVVAQAYPEFWKWNADHETLKLDRMRILDELNRDDGRGYFHRTHFPEELPPDPSRPEFVRPVGMQVFNETKTHIR